MKVGNCPLNLDVQKVRLLSARALRALGFRSSHHATDSWPRTRQLAKTRRIEAAVENHSVGAVAGEFLAVTYFLRRPSLLAQVALLAGMATVVAGGCTNGHSEQTTADIRPDMVTLSVAASTTDAVAKACRQFEAEAAADGNPVEVRINSGPSSSMASQILSGAPADVFLSANQKWADAVEDAGLIADRTDLLGNRLVVVVPAGNRANIQAPADLLGDDVGKTALAGEKVPAGIYADEALRALDLADSLQGGDRIVRGQSVRVVLGYVERDEVSAGIVYATDAQISDGVETVYQFDPSTHPPIVYPIVLLESARQSPAARQVYEFLQSEQAAATFAEFGFEVSRTR